MTLESKMNHFIFDVDGTLTAVVKPGRIMFEVAGVPHDVAKEALRLAAQKLPVKTRFIIATATMYGIDKRMFTLILGR